MTASVLACISIELDCCVARAGADADIIPGYGVPLRLRMCQPTSVPSLAYAYMTGGGGSSESSPDAVLWL